MLREGRGQGRGADYKPWLTVRDLSSRGESTRLRGWRSGKRLIHLFSRLERNFFFTLEWDSSVVDCREQFPLDLERTRSIADRLHIAHPKSPQTQLPVRMTTDFLVSRRANGSEVHQALSVKPLEGIELAGSTHPKSVKRNWEKFHIELEYWKGLGVPLQWVTERDFSLVLAQNVRSVHSFRDLGSLAPLTDRDVELIEADLFPRVTAGGQSLAALAAACDVRFGLPPGKSLRVVKHLVAQKRWKVDFGVPFDASYPVNLWK